MPRSINRVVFVWGLSVLAAAALGCQRGSLWKLAPVEGTVTKEGHPLWGIEVIFLADADAGTQGPRSSGITDEAGHYRLQTDNGREGAVTGKHRVLLLGSEAAALEELARVTQLPQGKEDIQHLPDHLKKAVDKLRTPPQYGHFHQTPLRVEVQPGPQVIDLEIK